MTTIESTNEETQRGTSRVRSVSAGVLGVLAVVVLLPATIAMWARATVFDSERIGDAVSGALARPEVDDALADWATDQIVTALDVNARVSDLVPDQLSSLEPAIASGVTTAVDRLMTRVIAEPRVQQAIANSAERAHARMVKLLEGDGIADGIKVVNGQVTVNLLPLIGRGLGVLQNLGLFDNLVIPELTADGDPAKQIADLEQATGRDLPDNFGQLVVYESQALSDAQASIQKAQQAVILAKRAVWLLAALTIAFVGGAIALARNRWRAVLWLGLGFAGAMILLRTAVRRVDEDAPALAVKPGGQAAIDSIVGDLSQGLMRLAGVIVIIAALAVLFSLFRRHWLQSDLVIVGAVLFGVIVLAVVGFSLVGLLLAAVVGAASWVTATRVLA
ncbi:MAG TPA: hypothetical protein VFE86_15220 [Ilumatobacteraceae bacterium]|nr:hypothetical protein [Ilumatobacteraceae bacterium]